MSIAAENIYQSILLRAADEWGIEYDDVERDIGQQFDPLIRFMAGGIASELEKVYQMLHNTEGRLQKRLARILLPEYFHLPQPAHALATATPSSDTEVIDETTTFIREEEDEDGIAFSPLFPMRLLPATLKVAATETMMLDPHQRVSLKRKRVSQEKDEARRILLGFAAPEPITNWQGASLWFDLRGRSSDESEKARLFAALSNSTCFIGNFEAHPMRGLPSVDLLLEDYLNGNERIQSMVRARYERHFLTFMDQVVPELEPVDPQEYLAKWFAASLPDEEAVNLQMSKLDPEIKEPLYWVQVHLSRPIEISEMATRLNIRFNVFPVVNRRICGSGNGEHHYLRTNAIKWIHLQPKGDFLSIRRVYVENPPEYTVFTFKPFADFKEDKKPAYTLRHGGVSRWDDFNAWQRLAYVVSILQDNYAHQELIQKAADSLSLEDIHHLLGKKISETASAKKPTKDIYVLLHTGLSSGIRVRVEYWTSKGEAANGVPPKATLKCVSRHAASLESDTLQLVTTSTDGRDPLNHTQQLDAMKSSLLSRGRIVTREDVKVFCREMLGDKLEDVLVQDGVGTDLRFNFGMTRLLDVELTPSKSAKKDDWEGVCQQLQTLLEQRSASSIPIRVRIATENTTA